MKKLLLAFVVLGALSLTSCGDDDDCKTCSDVLGLTEIKVCKLDNGNAEVDGTDTGTDYDTYISAYEIAGSCE